MIEPQSGLKFVIPYELIRPVEHGECLPDNATKISNLLGEKWWAKPQGLDQKEIVVCFKNGSFEKLHKMALKLNRYA